MPQIQLFRLTPRGKAHGHGSGEDGPPPTATPPNTQRSADEPGPGSTAGEIARFRLQRGVRRQLARSRGYHVMSTFIKSVQAADELSLINRARCGQRGGGGGKVPGGAGRV